MFVKTSSFRCLHQEINSYYQVIRLHPSLLFGRMPPNIYPGKLRASRVLKVSILALLCAACGFMPSKPTEDTPITEATNPAATTEAPAPPSSEATFTPLASRTPYVSPTPSPLPPGVDLPLPIYLLTEDQQQVFRLEPGGVALQPITPREWQVTAFDISPTDGRMAFGTENGELILSLPGKTPSIVLDVRDSIELQLYIRSVTWSPNGMLLAFGVDLTHDRILADPSAEQHGGIWLWDVENATRIQLLKNRYIPDGEDFNKLRVFTEPIWSPDGTGMLLSAIYWEWMDTLWLDPVAPDLEGNDLKDPFELDWVDASWSLDGESVLVSGKAYSHYGDLYRVDRSSLQAERLIDGEAEELFIFEAYELPTGIAFAAFEHPSEERLYLGNLTEPGFDFSPVGPEGFLCDRSGWITIQWDPTGRYALVTCNRQWRLISLDGSVDVELAPYFGSLVEEGQLTLDWGAEIKD